MKTATATLALVMVVGGGCALLSTPKDPARFYTLTVEPVGTSSPADAASPRAGDLADLTIGLGPITLPGYLERGAIATREGPTRVVYSDVDWWAEPLDAGIARTIRENLLIVSGASRVVRYPWLASAAPRYQVAIDVARFERNDAGEGELAARWVVQDVVSRRNLVVRESRIARPAPSPDTAGAVVALSGALADLSAEIGAAIRDLPRVEGSGKPAPAKRHAPRAGTGKNTVGGATDMR